MRLLLVFVIVFTVAYLVKKQKCSKKNKKDPPKEKKWYESIKEHCSNHELYF